MKKWAFSVTLALLAAAPLLAAPRQGYYRYPSLHHDTIVFTAEGDLWTVGVEGATAARLTTHPGEESHAAISPDGTRVAFIAHYEGPEEVYVMPLAGGVPTRLTYDGERARVVGWTPEGEILYATGRFSTLPDIQLVRIHPEAGTSRVVPLQQASDGGYDAPGTTLYFTRLPFQGSHTKRYKGGTAQSIWKFSEGAPDALPLTADFAGTSKSPMWWKGRIYFASDRDGTMNLWSMTEHGGDLTQHTFHQNWDVQSPSLSEGLIVYQLGADLRIFDTVSKKDRLVPITLQSDFDHKREKWISNPMEYLASVHLSPDGDRVVMTARGRVFVAPSREGRLVHATRDQGVRYREAQFMPDGKSLLVLSDRTGELEFYTVPANGVGEPKALTHDGAIFRFDATPSPDGDWIAYQDKNLRLWILDVKRGLQAEIAVSGTEAFSGLSWSPDSRWLAYAEPGSNGYNRIMLYSLETKTVSAITSGRVDSYSPAWSPDGKWIYFLSDRRFRTMVRSPWGQRQPDPFLDETTGIYQVALQAGERSPFALPDELHGKQDDKKSDVRKDDEKKRERKKEDGHGSGNRRRVDIDLEGIVGRTMEVPIEPGNYEGLSVTARYLFWISSKPGLDRKLDLRALEIKAADREVQTVAGDIKAYEVSKDGARVLIHKDDDLHVFDVGYRSEDTDPEDDHHSPDIKPDLPKSKVDLDKWTFSLAPSDEWRQMFTEAWRLERDYFYDPNMHGVDWPAVLERHLPLVDRVTDRAELSDLLAQMVGELSALHIYVVGGDHRTGTDPIEPASLGARLERDPQAGGYRVEHIYQGDPDYPHRLAPLARPGIDIKPGDIIESINGIPTLSTPGIGALLRNQEDRQVLLTVRSAKGAKAEHIIVTPAAASADQGYRYDEWEYTRRRLVDARGKGELGYVHLRAMGGGNFEEFVRGYYPVFNRKGLILDLRHNRGGNIDSWILGKLLRRIWFYWQPRAGAPTWNMQFAFPGPMVVICDEFTASDGEAFTEGFRRLGLGKIIGTRTWGGEIWLSFDNWLVDKGIASAAEYGVYGPEGEWLIEGRGVVPDIEVDNLPHATFNGEDAQLEAAIDHLLEQIRNHPVEIPPHPPYPDNSLK